MRNKTFAWTMAAWAVMVTPLVSGGVSAAEMDGSIDIVCAVIDVVGCLEEGGCVQGRTRSFDLPEFVILDAEEKVQRAGSERK